MSQTNPFTKGKSKLIAQLILDGKRNDEVFSFIKENKLDSKFAHPVSSKMIGDIRYRLKSDGYLKEEGITKKTPSLPVVSEVNEDLKEVTPIVTEKKEIITERPEWELLTVEQVNRIGDPKLRAEILGYKTEKQREREKQPKPEFATLEQFQQIEAQMKEQGGTLQEIMETLNSLKGDDPITEETEIVEESDPTLEEPTLDGLMETEQPTPKVIRASEGELTEIEGQLIAHRMIGFNSKSQMYYDIIKKKGFRGNLADFVNASINDAFKARKGRIKYVEEEEIE